MTAPPRWGFDRRRGQLETAPILRRFPASKQASQIAIALGVSRVPELRRSGKQPRPRFAPTDKRLYNSASYPPFAEQSLATRRGIALLSIHTHYPRPLATPDAAARSKTRFGKACQFCTSHSAARNPAPTTPPRSAPHILGSR
jgi:hypothetical protein